VYIAGWGANYTESDATGKGMKTSIEVISPVKKKLMVEIEAEEVTEKLNRAYRELGLRAKIPGFRAGKAPRKILESFFGKKILEDLTDDLLKETFPKAVEEINIFPVSPPIFENETIKSGQRFKYTAIMEVKPEFELKDYKGIEVEKEILNVRDEDVAGRLEEIRKASGKLISVIEDRQVKEDDYILIEYEGFEGDRPLAEIKSNNHLLKIGSKDFHPDFEKALIGHKKGEEIEVTIDYAKDFFHAKLAGRSIRFKARIIDIKEMELPVLNDEFAKNLGADFSGLDDLREKIKQDLLARENKRIDSELKKRLIKKIACGIDFDLPPSLVDYEIQYSIQNLKQNFIRSGSSLEKAGLDEEKLGSELRPFSENRVKEMLILAEIAAQNHVEVKDEEVTEGFSEIALSLGQDPDALAKYYETHQLMESFRHKLLEEKTLNYLVENAKIINIEAAKIARTEETS
jgi:trigger factor